MAGGGTGVLVAAVVAGGVGAAVGTGVDVGLGVAVGAEVQAMANKANPTNRNQWTRERISRSIIAFSDNIWSVLLDVTRGVGDANLISQSFCQGSNQVSGTGPLGLGMLDDRVSRSRGFIYAFA